MQLSFHLAVFTNLLGDYLEEHFACMRHERNAAVLPTFCLTSFFVKRHSGGIFPSLRNFHSASDEHDQAVELSKDGSVLAQTKFLKLGRKPVRSHCFRVGYRSERYCKLYLR